MRQRTRGVTLVELLTVITILGVLMAILLPAYNSARARARVTQCANNQKQISLAILEYESQKGHLPGYVNQLTPQSTTTQSNPPPVPFNWAEAIMPFIGHNDIWQKIELATTPAVTVDVLVCPDDSYVKANPTPGEMSYVVNDEYFYNNQQGPTGTLPPYDVTGKSAQKIILSKLPSTVGTVMLTENAPKVPSTTPSWTAHPGPWNTHFGTSTSWTNPPPTDFYYLTFNGLTGPVATTSPPLTPPTAISNVVVSPHGTTINLSFFDGHQQEYSTDAMFPLP